MTLEPDNWSEQLQSLELSPRHRSEGIYWAFCEDLSWGRESTWRNLSIEVRLHFITYIFSIYAPEHRFELQLTVECTQNVSKYVGWVESYQTTLQASVSQEFTKSYPLTKQSLWTKEILSNLSCVSCQERGGGLCGIRTVGSLDLQQRTLSTWEATQGTCLWN